MYRGLPNGVNISLTFSYSSGVDPTSTCGTRAKEERGRHMWLRIDMVNVRAEKRERER